MTDRDHRFCPRCGNALVAGQPFCSHCGFHVAGIAASSGSEADETMAVQDIASQEGTARSDRSEPRRTSGSPIILAAIIVAVGLIGYGLLTRPQAEETTAPSAGTSIGEVSLPPGATPLSSAPIVGLTIQSPHDGDVVATKEVTVIGLAPPGLSITRDVSLFPDQHAAVDSTGHWAIAVNLDQGDNTLVFRIGDDRSTEQRIRIRFTPTPE
jgi:hypothetical protein